jgi:hypothetical protein
VSAGWKYVDRAAGHYTLGCPQEKERARRDEAPDSFPVTDDAMDAPDGATVFIEEHNATYTRSGGTWFRKDR